MPEPTVISTIEPHPGVTVETLDGEATAVVAADRLVDPAGDKLR